jgi:hypothetical protein
MARKKEVGSEAESDPADARVEVEIISDHVYLPVGEDGNVPAAWREVPTVRIGKGTKLAMPADLVELLADKVARVA